MKIKYLGTGAAEGIPALFCHCDVCTRSRKEGGKNVRTRSQALINERLLIDFPADSLSHMHTYHIDLAAIQTLLFTHSHEDHFYPNDLWYRSQPYATGITDTLEVYGNHTVIDACHQLSKKRSLQQKDALHFTFVPPFIPFTREGLIITPLKANHKKDEDCYIYLIEHKGKRILYAHDTGFFPEETYKFLTEVHCDLISLDCTMGLISDGNNHLGFIDVEKVVNTLYKNKTIDATSKIVINHFSHNAGLMHREIEDKVKSSGYIVAYDGLEIIL